MDDDDGGREVGDSAAVDDDDDEEDKDEEDQYESNDDEEHVRDPGITRTLKYDGLSVAFLSFALVPLSDSTMSPFPAPPLSVVAIPGMGTAAESS